jgi:hypothetical protein
VKKVPVANTQEDFYEIEDTIGMSNDDGKALSMIKKGQVLMVENDTPVIVIESFGYLTKVKVKKGGRSGWVKSSWIQLEPTRPALNQLLLHAARDGQVKEVESLLDRGANINAQQDDAQGMTALMYAADGGHIEVVQLLIIREANLNLKDKNGWTALSGLADSVDERQEAIILILKSAGAK